MIYIKKKYPDEHTVELVVDGMLNKISIPPLKQIIEKGLFENRTVCLQLDGIMHADREGINFLRRIKTKVIMEGMSDFLRLQIDD
ncbi:MAG: hypothetical protein JRI43_00105 [Deltaproteobacteria bacterium]|nr:hypothetical protein [Deltaproteobacteria bacterium]